ncbi:MAG: thioredoxin family protein [Gammaproteobacteria bacterium]
MAALNPPAVEIGLQAKSFSLKGTDNKIHTLESLQGKNGTVIMFMCNHCPFVKAVAKKLPEAVSKLHSVGVNFIGINSNNAAEYSDDSFDNMLVFAKENNFNFPYLVDDMQEVAKSYGAVCTPDIFGFNKNLQLQYRGRFDDSGMQIKPDSRNELVDAMLEIAANGSFTGNQTASIGCSIKWKV